MRPSSKGKKTAFQAVNRGSNPLGRSKFYAVLAQSVEHLPCKQDVVSSIPTDSTISTRSIASLTRENIMTGQSGHVL